MEGIHAWPMGRPGGRRGAVRGTGWGRGVGAGLAAGVGVTLVRLEHRMVTRATTPMVVAKAASEIPPIIRDLVELSWISKEVWRMMLLEWAARSCWLCCGGGGGGVAVVAGVLATAEYTSPPAVQHIMKAAVAKKAFLCCRQHEMT